MTQHHCSVLSGAELEASRRANERELARQRLPRVTPPRLDPNLGGGIPCPCLCHRDPSLRISLETTPGRLSGEVCGVSPYHAACHHNIWVAWPPLASDQRHHEMRVLHDYSPFYCFRGTV